MARIMIVEDDSAVRRLVRRLLEGEGHTVIEEPDGRSALRHFAGDPADLVISDVYMPDMDGLELLERLREAFPEVRVIVISGGGRLRTMSVLEDAKGMGAARVIAKPFSPEEFRSAVREVLSASRPTTLE